LHNWGAISASTVTRSAPAGGSRSLERSRFIYIIVPERCAWRRGAQLYCAPAEHCVRIRAVPCLSERSVKNPLGVPARYPIRHTTVTEPCTVLQTVHCPGIFVYVDGLGSVLGVRSCNLVSAERAQMGIMSGDETTCVVGITPRLLQRVCFFE
jgi:hypothetical protein